MGVAWVHGAANVRTAAQVQLAAQVRVAAQDRMAAQVRVAGHEGGGDGGGGGDGDSLNSARLEQSTGVARQGVPRGYGAKGRASPQPGLLRGDPLLT